MSLLITIFFSPDDGRWKRNEPRDVLSRHVRPVHGTDPSLPVHAYAEDDDEPTATTRYVVEA